MPQIKPGRYSDDPKGFLTYPILGEKDTTGIQSVLLKEAKKSIYILDDDITKIKTERMSIKLSAALGDMGIRTIRTTKLITMGRKSLKVFKAGKEVKLHVEIRKVMDGRKLIGIQIRITGKTAEDLIENINLIRNSLAKWHITPKHCVWSQGKWQEHIITEAPIIPESETEKEMRRIKAILQSQSHDLAELKEERIKKSMREDREVMKGILD